MLILGHAFVPLLPSVWPVSFVPKLVKHPRLHTTITFILNKVSSQHTLKKHRTPYLSFNDYLWLSKKHLITNVFFQCSLDSIAIQAAPWNLLNQVPRRLHWLRLVPATPSSNDKESPDVAPNSSRHSILIHSDQYYCTRWYRQWRLLISKWTKGRFLGSNSLYESLSNKVWRLLESTKGSNECDDLRWYVSSLEGNTSSPWIDIQSASLVGSYCPGHHRR